MKVKVPLALAIVLAIAIGYLMGTESGRQQRDVILVKLGRTRAGDAQEVATGEPGEDGED